MQYIKPKLKKPPYALNHFMCESNLDNNAEPFHRIKTYFSSCTTVIG